MLLCFDITISFQKAILKVNILTMIYIFVNYYFTLKTTKVTSNRMIKLLYDGILYNH